MTIMLLSGAPEITSVVAEHKIHVFRRYRCRDTGSITGFCYERCVIPVYLDYPLRFHAKRDDSYGFTSWTFSFYLKGSNRTVWRMCITPDYSNVATYDAGSAEEQLDMHECLIEAFSTYYRYTLLAGDNCLPLMWSDTRTVLKEKTLYNTPTSLYEHLYLRGRDGKQTLLDQIADILSEIDTDRQYKWKQIQGCLLSPSGAVIKLDHITDEQSILDGVYRYDTVSSILILAPNAPSIKKSVFAYEKAGYTISTISRLLAIPTDEVRAMLRA